MTINFEKIKKEGDDDDEDDEDEEDDEDDEEQADYDAVDEVGCVDENMSTNQSDDEETDEMKTVIELRNKKMKVYLNFNFHKKRIKEKMIMTLKWIWMKSCKRMRCLAKQI